MLDEYTIERKSEQSEETSFESLRQEGIDLLQKLSGDVWTDFNDHDPGVTILEQLCYALTDLQYRTGFGVADFLADSNGNIDFEESALYRPESIFPSGPVSINDYRKIFFDGVPELDNVWVESLNGDEPTGLYRIYALLGEEVEEEGKAAEDQISDKIERLYTKNRNLGEDLEDISFVQTRQYALHGTVEVSSERDVSQILAEVYLRASRYISPSIEFHSLQELHDRGASLSTLFSGPLTNNVHIEDDELNRTGDPITISELSGIIEEIEGVTRVSKLSFKNDRGDSQSIPYDHTEFVPRLEFPVSRQDVGLQVIQNNRDATISLRDVRGQFDRRQGEYRSARRTRQGISEISSLPRGKFRNLNEYFSVQTNFPGNYGIDKDGIPESAQPQRKAQARQLKAYLLFFDQVMANYLENLQRISRLFSRDTQLSQSYWHHDLSMEEVPNIEELYGEAAGIVSSRIAEIVAGYDNFADRRGRVLDYLLAIYGESFDQGVLRQLNFYYTDRELENEGIRNKLNLLKLIGSPI